MTMFYNNSINASVLVNASVLPTDFYTLDSTSVSSLEYDESVNIFWKNRVFALLYIVYLAISILVGNAGNIAVLGAIATSRRLQTTDNVLVINLGLVDLLITLVLQPFCLLGAVEGESFFYDKGALCDFLAAVCLISVVCSTWTITAISLNRYVCICHNANHRMIFSRRNMLLLCVGIWFFSLSLESPNILIWRGHFYDPKIMTCTFDRTANPIYSVILVCVVVIPTVSIISFSYVSIWRHVRSNKKILLYMSDTAVGSNMRRIMRRGDIELAKTSLTVCITFIICWTPSSTILVFDKNNDWPRYVYLISMQIAYATSFLNFIIYGKVSMRFRAGYYQLLYRFRPSCCRSSENAMQDKIRQQKPELQIDRYS